MQDAPKTQINVAFINTVLKLDTEIVNKGFEISNDIGIAATKNCISEFRTLLVKEFGEFINGMNMQYRIYIVGLLQGIKEEYLPEVMRVIL